MLIRVAIFCYFFGFITFSLNLAASPFPVGSWAFYLSSLVQTNVGEN